MPHEREREMRCKVDIIWDLFVPHQRERDAVQSRYYLGFVCAASERERKRKNWEKKKERIGVDNPPRIE